MESQLSKARSEFSKTDSKYKELLEKVRYVALSLILIVFVIVKVVAAAPEKALKSSGVRVGHTKSPVLFETISRDSTVQPLRSIIV